MAPLSWKLVATEKNDLKLKYIQRFIAQKKRKRKIEEAEKKKNKRVKTLVLQSSGKFFFFCFLKFMLFALAFINAFRISYLSKSSSSTSSSS